MSNKTAVVTGATSGLGEAAALALANEGWKVFVVGRDEERGAEVVRRSGGRAEFLKADLFSLTDVKRLAKEIADRVPSLDLLVNNAGGTFGAKSLTVDGLERTFALNVAAPFVLTEGLLAPLAKAKGRVVNVVTGVPNGAKATMDQLAGDAAGSGMGSYIRAKLALVTLTREQQRRLAAKGITAVSLHPGVIMGTRFGQDFPKPVHAVMELFGKVAGKVIGFTSTLDEAAARYVKVGTEPVEGGGFYKQGVLAPPPKQANDEAFAQALWSKLATYV